MTPVTFLVAFCAVMTVLAFERLSADRHRDPIDVGAALVVAGITLLAFCWVAFAESWLGITGRIATAVVGALVAAAGVALLVPHWDGNTTDSKREGNDTE